MSGAAALAGLGALRGGAGLVQVATPASVADIVASHDPCYMAHPLPCDPETGQLSARAAQPLLALAQGASAVGVGPGLGQSAEAAEVVRLLTASAACPIVLDADALNVLGPWPGVGAMRRAPAILTPHPGEMARLTGRDTRAVQAGRMELAAEVSRREGCVVLLKGAGTIVTDGARAYVNATGNPGMATGGCGDVLTGLITALLAQGMAAFDAACLGAFLHGLAGDLAARRYGEVSMTALDLARELPAAFQAGNLGGGSPE
jgi:NAD(P)H-hydrate epimerase